MLKPFATKLDEKTITQLDEISRKTQIPKSRLCRQAIELLAMHYDKLEEDRVFGEKMRKESAFDPEPVETVSSK